MCAPSDQPPSVECNAFSGYNDPKHPALLKVSFFGPSLLPNSVLYVIVGGVETPISKCVKVKGVFTNTPCLVKEQVKKKKGVITEIIDTIALLSTDPGIARR